MKNNCRVKHISTLSAYMLIDSKLGGDGGQQLPAFPLDYLPTTKRADAAHDDRVIFNAVTGPQTTMRYFANGVKRDVFKFAAPATDEMMMWLDVGIIASHRVIHKNLMNQSGIA